MRRRCQRRVVGMKIVAHGQGRPATPIAPDAVASIAPQPAVRYDRDPPPCRGPGCFACTTNPNFGKVEYFARRGLTRWWWRARVFCPTGNGRRDVVTITVRVQMRWLAAFLIQPSHDQSGERKQ